MAVLKEKVTEAYTGAIKHYIKTNEIRFRFSNGEFNDGNI